jgi:WD40 repeat protein
VSFSVSFDTDDSKLSVTLRADANRIIIACSAKDGTQLDPLAIVEDGSNSYSDEGDKSLQRFCPVVLSLSPLLEYATVTYSTSHLTILSLDEEDNLERICRVEIQRSEDSPHPPHILDIVYNPAIESYLMAVAYQDQDGDIVTVEIDEWNPRQTNVYSMHARVLACSPDSRTFAAADTEGGISLFNFDALQLMHRIEVLEEFVTGNIFSSNNIRLYGVRGRSCKVWEPPKLVRKDAINDNSSDPDEIVELIAPNNFVTRSFDDVRAITVITPVSDDKLVFCARDDGSITIHELKNGDLVREIKLHAVDVRLLEWN